MFHYASFSIDIDLPAHLTNHGKEEYLQILRPSKNICLCLVEDSEDFLDNKKCCNIANASFACMLTFFICICTCLHLIS